MAVLIAGGGIGGLTTAIALERQGIETCVLERTAFTEESGAGIQLGPNATRILRTLGVLDALRPHVFQPEAVWIFDGLSGRKLTSVPLGTIAEARHGAPYVTVHRADLHACLKATAESARGIELRPSFTATHIDDGTAVSVSNSEGTSLQGSTLIGADGIWSTIRSWMAPQARLTFTGATAYRALLSRKACSDENLPIPFHEPIVGLWLGPKSHLVHYPVRGGTHLNVVAVIEAGQKSEGWSRTPDLASLKACFAPWGAAPQALLNAAGSFRAWSLFSLAGLRAWSQGKVSLLGDAAHPVLPYLAQGAGLAIEDAACLAKVLSEPRELPGPAFQAYEALRRPRALQVQRTAQRLGRAYHMSGPLRHVRNAILGIRSPEASLHGLDWLYGEPSEPEKS